MNAEENGHWMKLNDAAKALGVSEITLRRKIKGGKLHHEFRDGRYYVYVSGQSDQIADDSSLLRSSSESELKALHSHIDDLHHQIHKKDELIGALRRSLEDQQTLISFLEEALSQVSYSTEQKRAS